MKWQEIKYWNKILSCHEQPAYDTKCYFLEKEKERKGGDKKKRLRNIIFSKTCTLEKSKHNSLKLARGSAREPERSSFNHSKTSYKILSRPIAFRGKEKKKVVWFENNVVLLNSAPSCSEINYDFIGSTTQTIPIAKMVTPFRPVHDLL